jgi:hypothetical protein
MAPESTTATGHHQRRDARARAIASRVCAELWYIHRQIAVRIPAIGALSDTTTARSSPMETHRAGVSGSLGVPDAVESALDEVDPGMLRVPDVRLCSEPVAIARLVAAGLVPGERSPRPRPIDGRPEVVIRTHPRADALVRRGTRIDYELAPGQPRDDTTTTPSRDTEDPSRP